MGKNLKRYLSDERPNVKKFKSGVEKSVHGDSKGQLMKSVSTPTTGTQQSRKSRRKELRKLKKARRLAFSQRKPLPTLEDLQKDKNKAMVEENKKNKMKEMKAKKKKMKKKRSLQKKRAKEMEIQGQRLAILKEDKEIKKMEKQLKMNKKRVKLPSAFVKDGLDYILESLDSDKLQETVGAELLDSDDSEKMALQEDSVEDDQEWDSEEGSREWDSEGGSKEQDSEEENSESEDHTEGAGLGYQKKSQAFETNSGHDSFETFTSSSQKEMPKSILKKKDTAISDLTKKKLKTKKSRKETKVKWQEKDSSDSKEEMGNNLESDENKETDGIATVKEDIYGRVRDDGGAYIPPAKRSAMSGDSSKRKLLLGRLKRQIKGLINRASESNMQPICSQIENIYMSHSRADVNETLAAVIVESCVSPVLTPERLVLELTMLVTLLHGNVGSEVGAYFIQTVAKKFAELSQQKSYGEGKQMANVVLLVTDLYNFKVIHNTLVFDILKKFSDSFQERDIELVLLLLKNAGFSLRKDDPAALKDVIVQLQVKASTVDTTKFEDQSRVRFMLEVLMAIKNNNMRKIPGYDLDHLEHLKKLTRNYIRGSGLTDNQLNIGLDDLLKAEECGRWWLVGSAWDGRQQKLQTAAGISKTVTSIVGDSSTKLMDLARKQRMNTVIRKNIFCVIMSSEDFIDSFEKLLRLGLKHQQEREIIHVILDCCQQEKKFNPFYAYLVQKFCEYDRRFQMTVQFSLWDKFKEMGNLSEQNRQNLAKLCCHLLVTKGLSLSFLKVVEFGTLGKPMVHFLKHLLSNLLLNHPQDVVESVFTRIAVLEKLHHLREGLKLFMHHFLQKHKGSGEIDNLLLIQRVKMADRILSTMDTRILL